LQKLRDGMMRDAAVDALAIQAWRTRRDLQARDDPLS
jgi:hypothetical protein